MSDSCIRLFDDYFLDLNRGSLLRGDQPVHLRPQTYEVLRCLVANRGRLMSKDQLIEDVWQGRAVTDGSLGKCIEELRAALGENAGTYLRNVRGRGYLLETDTPKREELLTASEQIDVVRMVILEEAKENSASIRQRKNVLIVALMVLGVAVIGLGYLVWQRRSSPPAQITSIAVLPFLNESGDSNADYLSDGISESLINNLSQLRHLKVIARTSSFSYKEKVKQRIVDLQQVANALQVEGIVTGRIARSGDNLMVSVELIDTRDNKQIWGDQYNRRNADVVEVQGEISRAISRTLRSQLTAIEAKESARGNVVRPEAYDLFIRGRYSWRKGDRESTESG